MLKTYRIAKEFEDSKDLIYAGPFGLVALNSEELTDNIAAENYALGGKFFEPVDAPKVEQGKSIVKTAKEDQ